MQVTENRTARSMTTLIPLSIRGTKKKEGQIINLIKENKPDACITSITSRNIL